MTIYRRLSIIFLVCCLVSVNAFGGDLELTDGRILKDARLLSPSSTDIAVIHAGGVENISFDLLPAEIRSNYAQAISSLSLKAQTKTLVNPSSETTPELGVKNIGNVTNATEAMDAVVLVNTYDESGEFLGHGTGFYFGNCGHVVTNVHVIDGATTVEVVEQDGDKFTLESCLFAIPCRDFAILKVDTDPDFYFRIAGVPEIKDKVVALGHPLDERWFHSTGEIEKAHKFGYQLHHSITAELKPGNSGGPVINEDFEVVGQSQYVITRIFAFTDGVWTYKITSKDFRTKCIDFAGDRRWSIWNSSFEELTQFNADYEKLEAYVLLLSNLYEIYEVALDAGNSISYVRDVEYNHSHMGIDGKPLITKDQLKVDWKQRIEVERFSSAAIKYFDERLKSSEKNSSIAGLLWKSRSAFSLINRGVQQINRANGQSYRRGTQVFSSGRGIIRQSKSSMRDMLWECRSRIEHYGPPNSWNEETYNNFVRTSDLIKEKTGKALID